MATLHTVTATANYGPGKRVTSGVVKNVSELHLFPDRRMMQIAQESNVINEFETQGITSFTVTFSGNTWTVTMSA